MFIVYTVFCLSLCISASIESVLLRPIVRPRRSRSAAAYSHQTFPWSICRSVLQCVRASVCPLHCGKTADRIRMPFGVIARTGPGMRQVVGFVYRSTGRGTFGANLGRAIEPNGDFTAYVCDSASTVGAAVWGAACGGPRHCCIRWGPRRAKERGGLGFLFPIFTMGNATGSPTVKCFRLVCENFTTFPFAKRIVGKLDSWAFWR